MKYIVAWKHRELVGYSNKVKEFDTYEYSKRTNGTKNAKIAAQVFASRLVKMGVIVYAVQEKK